MPTIFVILLLAGCDWVWGTLTNSDNKSNHIKGEELNIYPIEVVYISNLYYQNFDIKNAPIIGNPIITCAAIISYDTTSHILKLTY